MSVYFIRNERGHIKIGHANDPWARLQELQCAASGALALVRVIDGDQKTEYWLHRRFAAQRIRGEWFYFLAEMLTIVAPDEIPPKPKRRHAPYESAAEFLRAADAEGLLSERMRRDYAPLLVKSP